MDKKSSSRVKRELEGIVMSVLPKIPYTMRKNKSQIVSMRGINYSNVTQDGDIADSKGISARSYPYITTRKEREKQGQYSNVTAMTVFNNKIVVVADGKLYWGGQEIGELTPGEKQFAPINSKLCIMPDKKYFDSRTMTLEDMGAEAHSLGAVFTKNSVTLDDWWTQRAWGYGCEISDNSITFPKRVYASRIGDGTRLRVFTEYFSETNNNNVTESIARIYIEGQRALGMVKYKKSHIIEDGVYKYERVTFTDGFDTSDLAVGDWLWLGGERHRIERKFSDSSLDCMVYRFHLFHTNSLNASRWGWTSSMVKNTSEKEDELYKIEALPDFLFDSDYIYFNIDGNVIFKPNHSKRAAEKRTLNVDYKYSLEDYVLKEFYNDYLKNGIYDCDLATVGWDVDLTEKLTVGQEVMLKDRAGNVFKAETSAITENSITFVDGTVIDEAFDGNLPTYNLSIYVSEWDDGSEEIKNLGKYFKKGDCVTISGSTENDMSFIVDGIDGLKLTASAEIFVEGGDTRFIMIERRIPDFDYICSSENRIWGCSNKDNTIYASALGDPTNFFVNTGISTDSYAVAVGSEGRFTACCRFGSSVLFWKETKLHKVLGSYPAEYTLYSYDFEGVQEGSHKSLQIINEVLYYKGIHGIYAFDSSPTLISSNFGDRYFTDAVAGVDGDSYYISMRGEDERDYLFVYETLPGLWVLEDDVKVFDFARIGKDMYMLTESGEFYLCGAKDTETDMEWLVQLTPFYETVEGRKTYSRLLLRVELPQGSFLRVEVRADGRAWREAGKIVGKRQDVVPVLIPVNRCDKFEIRLSGKGKCTVMSILREFYVGGEK